ncbi:acetyl-CoA C-acetyltransferase [Moritella sp. 24]|uniref:acetyl-CoA C-acetyltransferase n=1 Tax=Moritella sp. 24 TaxID=2746230 RepID=UPI001BACAF9F|nr:acetyl-CoA C-acetyltransferase [Moritella sp. 24]QUM76657.1 acetyl-CoA C-acetyltransferase [Moritella sp. 24]
MIPQAFIYDAIRTPRGLGKISGALHEVKPVNLLADLLNHLYARNGFDTDAVDDIVLGCVTPIADQGADIAKTAALVAGWKDNVAGVSLNRFCASGLESVNMAAMKIRSGWEHLVIAGGIESMSRVPMGSDGGAWSMDPETSLATDYMPQGIGADLIATLDGYNREDVDAFAARSHQRATAAWERGAFNQSVVPVHDRNGTLLLDKDELVRPDCTVTSLAKLNPAFEHLGRTIFDSVAKRHYPQVGQIQHVHTPGNASGIVDGAALVLLGSEEAGRRWGLKARARVVATAVVGSDPTMMLAGPVPAAKKVLAVAGLSITDIDLFEVNEAFAAVVMRFMTELDISADIVNVNGGSIAMGHPLGATGAIILGTLLDELEARHLQRGLVTLCVGGGMGIATIIERVEG